MMMKKAVLSVLLLAGCSADSPSSSLSTTASRGGSAASSGASSSESSLSMQTWMKANASAAMNAQDHQRLFEVFGRIEEIGPNGPADDPRAEFRDWKSMAAAGAEAAKKHDLERVRAACKNCHDVYRPAYKARLRSRALPSRTGS